MNICLTLIEGNDTIYSRKGRVILRMLMRIIGKTIKGYSIISRISWLILKTLIQHLSWKRIMGLV